MLGKTSGIDPKLIQKVYSKMKNALQSRKKKDAKYNKTKESRIRTSYDSPGWTTSDGSVFDIGQVRTDAIEKQRKKEAKKELRDEKKKSRRVKGIKV